VPVIVGVLLGFGAALSQSLSYLFSRVLVRGVHLKAWNLLALSHVIMAAFSIALLPVFWPKVMPPFREYALPLSAVAVSYLAGQVGLFLALRTSDASRVAPLLGLKIIILAVVTVSLFGKHYSPLQWTAVILSVAAAAMLNRFGDRMAWQSVLWVLFTCVGYAISDLNIPPLVSHFGSEGLMRASAFSTCLCYILCGAITAAMLPFLPRISAKAWLGAVPFSLAWFIAMLLLFASFSSIGVVYGNIVQSSRGVLSILIGAVVAAAGLEHLEVKTSRTVLIQRVFAAVLLTGAIALFQLGGPKPGS